EQKLGLTTVPLSFPIGMGYDFQGIYNLWNSTVRLFEGESKTTVGDSNLIESLDDPALETSVGAIAKATLEEELELVREVYPSFDRKAYLRGEQHPVFFGSALNNFGVQ
ncbi:MAG: peptide chain release factor 3, partial [Flavobacteriaceae bacterium]